MTPPPRSSASCLRASSLGVGAGGMIAAVEGAPDCVERLAAMGLTPGVAVRVMGAGSPMTLAVGESRLALGRALADALLVAPL